MPPTIPSDILTEVLSFLSRHDLDCLQLAAQRLNFIVKASFKKRPFRIMYAVLVDKPEEQGGELLKDQPKMNPTTVIYSKNRQLKRDFKSLEDLITMKNKQNVEFEHITIYDKDSDDIEIRNKLMSLIDPSHLDIPKVFYYHQNISQLVPQFPLPQDWQNLYRSYKMNTKIFESRAMEYKWSPVKANSYLLSHKDLLTWLHFNNTGDNCKTPRILKTNYYRFVDAIDVFVEKMFECFQNQNQPCQFEIIVGDLGKENILDASKLNKTARNYGTNEVMESFCLKNSSDEALQQKYNNAEWVLRRRLYYNLEFPIAFDKSKMQDINVSSISSGGFLYTLWFSDC